MKANKVRLDLLLVERALAPTREKAKSLLMSGQVFIDGVRRDKAGFMVDPQVEITIKGRGLPFASRGGFKLEKALKVFNIDVKDKVVADLGASTGGFTDCLLKAGASKVYAIDVGYGLLDYKLREDERVIVMDRTNARYLTPEQFDPLPDLVSIDLSFISLELVLPAVNSILDPHGQVVTLIKPQFEAGPQNIKGGVVHDPLVHEMVLNKFVNFCQDNQLHIINWDFSPIKGPAGNIEFLAHLEKGATQEDIRDSIKALVERSWREAKTHPEN
ncbi:TlyA family RNA methyltransferase [bacterium]|nr:TlyA family RNA methyltransferase [bacterium]